MAQTPAQWRVNPSGNISNGEFTIAELGGIYAEKAEYARLIAAAPALLAALEACISAIDDEVRAADAPDHPTIASHARAADIGRKAVALAKQAP